MLSPRPETRRSPPLIPADCGAKVRFKVIFCPPLKTIGNAAPLTENPVPDIWKFESVTFHERRLVSVIACVTLPPTATWPNEMVEGLAAKASVAAPAASSATRRTEFEASLLNVIDVPTQPTLVGEKVTLNGTLLPAGITSGKVKPDTLNSCPLSFTTETVTALDPAFDNIATWVSLCPTRTSPKCTPDGVHVSCSAACADNGNSMTMAAKLRKEKTRSDS